MKNLINEYFNFNFRKDIYVLANGLMGFFPFFTHSMKQEYCEDISFFEKIDKINFWEKKLSHCFWSNENLSWTLIFICKAKLFLLFSELDNARLFLNKAKECQGKMPSDISDSAKNWINFCLDLLDLQLESHKISIKVDEKLTILAKDMDRLAQKISAIGVEIEQHPVHSEKELELSYQALEMFLENSRLLVQKEENTYLDKETVNELHDIRYRLNVFYDKTRGLTFPYENEVLLNLILVEKIRIGFYLGVDMKDTFNLVYQFCRYQISVGNNDPIEFLNDMQWTETVCSHHPSNKQKNFEQYLYSFVLKINKTNKNEVTVALKQLSNFVAKDLNERLIIVE